ncbi:MAG: hypothetical protein VKI82_02510 [Leptolyngbya sp.]|nr:hypothetical protein [Leptolyngbya sp.]
MTVDPTALDQDALDQDALERYLETLRVYGQTYGIPSTPEQRQGIAATVLRLLQDMAPHSLPLDQGAEILAQATAAWEDIVAMPSPPNLGEAFPIALGQPPLAEGAAALLGAVTTLPTATDLAQMAHHWHDQLQQQIQATLAGYIQHHTPPTDPLHLQSTVLTLIPLLVDGALTSAEVRGLLRETVTQFDPASALATQVNPAVLEGVQRLVTALRQKPLEVAVRDTAVAYLAEGAASLMAVGEGFLEQVLQTVLKHQADFGLEVDLARLDSSLILRQVSFQLNVMKALPPPSKTAQRMAIELQTAIANLPDRPAPVDVSTGHRQQGNLSVSSPFTSQRQPIQDDEQAD